MYTGRRQGLELVLRRGHQPGFTGGALYLWRSIQRIIEGKARYRDWKLVREQGIFPAHYLFLPEAWRKPLPKEGVRLLVALGLGGKLVRELVKRGAKASWIASQIGRAEDPLVSDALRFLIGLILQFPLAMDEQKDMVDEAFLFAQNRFRLRDCPRGHLYISGPRKRMVCDAHKWAEVQRRRRLREKQGIPPKKKQSTGVKR